MLMESLSLRRLLNIQSTLFSHMIKTCNFSLFQFNLSISHLLSIVCIGVYFSLFDLNKTDSVFVIYGAEKHIQRADRQGERELQKMKNEAIKIFSLQYNDWRCLETHLEATHRRGKYGASC